MTGVSEIGIESGAFPEHASPEIADAQVIAQSSSILWATNLVCKMHKDLYGLRN